MKSSSGAMGFDSGAGGGGGSISSGFIFFEVIACLCFGDYINGVG